ARPHLHRTLRLHEQNNASPTQRTPTAVVPDAVLLRFLAEMLHPVVRTDAEELRELLEIFNTLLTRDGYALVPVDSISGYTIYGGRRVPVQARPVI
ncbi:AbiJ-related protein, partial [Streptomyces cinereoruber]